MTCAHAISACDGKWLTAAGLIPVRKKPGSAKGALSLTIEDETGVANLVIWPSLYERQRRAPSCGAQRCTTQATTDLNI